MYNFEVTVLCSVLENIHIGGDKRIMEAELKESYFNNIFHRLLVRGINRLKALGEPVNTDFLRQRFVDAGKWDFVKDHALIDIISHNPCGTFELFDHYLGELKKQNRKDIFEV